MTDTTTITHPQKRAFLAAYSELGNVSRAAAIAGISRESHYDWNAQDAAYAAAYERARELAGDALEDEARRRAVEGVAVPKFYRGEICGHVTEYSDSLLITLLRGAKPKIYRDHVSAEVSGPGGGPVAVQLDLSKLSDADLETLRAMCEKLKGGAE